MKKHRFLNTLSVCLLTLAVFVSLALLIPTKADAATYNGFTYTVSGGKATITDYSGSAAKLTIPSTLGGYPVTSIGNRAFQYCSSLTSVTIPDSLESIGNSAFDSCTSLTSVTIPDSVTSIGSYAFYYCYRLTSVTIGDSVTSIGVSAFSECSSLTGVTIPDSVESIGYAAFSGCTSLTYNVYDNAKYLGNEHNPYVALITTTSDAITACTIHPDTKFIYYSAFSSCDSLTSMTIPDSVESIGDSAFYECYRLTSVTIPDSVTSIGDSAFSGCTSLTSVTIPDSVESIGSHAFYNCSSLADVYITDPNAWCKIKFGQYSSNPIDYGDHLHLLDEEGNEVTELILDNTVTAIPDDAFKGSTITSVTIPDSVESIGNDAFSECYSLISVTIGSSVTSIGDDAFSSCSSLTSVTIPDSVASIGMFSFSCCFDLSCVTMGTGVTSVGYWAFHGCLDLTDVYYGGTQTQWSAISFDEENTDLTSANIHYQHIHDYTLFPSVTVEPTCTQNGYTEYTCAFGETFRQPILALGHDYNGAVTVVDPTCLKDGYTLTQCTRCSDTQTTDPVSALGHKYNIFVSQVEPTCLDGGYTTYACSRCDAQKDDDKVSALGHDFSVFVDTVEPTCLEEGYSVYQCVRCEEHNITDYVPALDHDYSGTVTVVDPTCQTEGYTETQCIRCDSTEKTNYKNIVAHKMAILPAVDPTCTESGLTVGTACKWCGLVGVAQKEVAATGHSYVDHEAKAPTCTESGWAAYQTCENCDYTTYEEITATGHDYVDHEAKAPTCTEPGLTLGTACKWCGMVGVAQKEVAALGGSCDYSADPTTCANCGYVRADVDITNVVLRPSCSGLYFKGAFSFGAHEIVTRYGIAVSLYNTLPVADDTDSTSLYTIGETSVLISDIMKRENTEDQNGIYAQEQVYARAYVLLSDGTYVYGSVISVSLAQLCESVDAKWDALTDSQRNSFAGMYDEFAGIMRFWEIPNIRKIKGLTYEEYVALSPEEQEKYYISFSSLRVFNQWYNYARRNYYYRHPEEA